MIGWAVTADLQRSGAQRVLILGEDAPGGLMHSFERAFRQLGADTDTYCLVRAYRAGLPRNAARIVGRLAPAAMLDRFNQRVVSELTGRRFDLVLVLKGERLRPETVRAVQSATGALIVNYYPDDPFSESRANRLAYGPAVLAAYDHCFTFGGNLLLQYEAAGIQRASWLPFARDPDMHSPVGWAVPGEFDVVFGGNLDEERVRWLEPVARRLRLLVLAEHRRAARGTALARATFAPAAYGTDLPRALSRAPISLNVMREQNRLNHNMRSFESPACGAFTVSQRTPELERMFREHDEVVFADDPVDLVARIEYWLAHPAERQRIARLGYQRVAIDTYRERALTILSTLGIAAAPATA